MHRFRNLTSPRWLVSKVWFYANYIRWLERYQSHCEGGRGICLLLSGREDRRYQLSGGSFLLSIVFVVIGVVLTMWSKAGGTILQFYLVGAGFYLFGVGVFYEIERAHRKCDVPAGSKPPRSNEDE